jgi:hypothetical protein
MDMTGSGSGQATIDEIIASGEIDYIPTWAGGNYVVPSKFKTAPATLNTDQGASSNQEPAMVAKKVLLTQVAENAAATNASPKDVEVVATKVLQKVERVAAKNPDASPQQIINEVKNGSGEPKTTTGILDTLTEVIYNIVK